MSPRSLEELLHGKSQKLRAASASWVHALAPRKAGCSSGFRTHFLRLKCQLPLYDPGRTESTHTWISKIPILNG